MRRLGLLSACFSVGESKGEPKGFVDGPPAEALSGCEPGPARAFARNGEEKAAAQAPRPRGVCGQSTFEFWAWRSFVKLHLASSPWPGATGRERDAGAAGPKMDCRLLSAVVLCLACDVSEVAAFETE